VGRCGIRQVFGPCDGLSVLRQDESRYTHCIEVFLLCCLACAWGAPPVQQSALPNIPRGVTAPAYLHPGAIATGGIATSSHRRTNCSVSRACPLGQPTMQHVTSEAVRLTQRNFHHSDSEVPFTTVALPNRTGLINGGDERPQALSPAGPLSTAGTWCGTSPRTTTTSNLAKSRYWAVQATPRDKSSGREVLSLLPICASRCDFSALRCRTDPRAVTPSRQNRWSYNAPLARIIQQQASERGWIYFPLQTRAYVFTNRYGCTEFQGRDVKVPPRYHRPVLTSIPSEPRSPHPQLI
jgi:hypothetical protein